jgi:DNA repair exonuclease SbcCD ATPase subunit
MKKYLREIIIGGLILALLLVSTCANKQSTLAEGQKIELEKQVSELKDSIVKTENERVAEKDSLDKDSAKKQLVIDSLNQNDIKNKQQIAELKDKLSKKKKEVAAYNTKQVATFINDRYNTNTTIATPTTITASDFTGVKIVTELVEKDTCEKVVVEQEQRIKDKDRVIEETIGQLENVQTELTSAEESIDIFKDHLKKADKLHDVDNKIIRKLKVSNTVKWILIPAAFIGGVLIAK